MGRRYIDGAGIRKADAAKREKILRWMPGAGETKSRAENQLCAANRRRLEMHLNPIADMPMTSIE